MRAQDRGGPLLAAASERVRRAGAVGHLRARLAGRTRAGALPGAADRRRDQLELGPFRGARRDAASTWPCCGSIWRRTAGWWTCTRTATRCSRWRRAPEKASRTHRRGSADADWDAALRELGIGWIAAYSPQAKGRIERSFRTAQDRLVKDLRLAKVSTMEAANTFLETRILAGVECSVSRARSRTTPISIEP